MTPEEVDQALAKPPDTEAWKRVPVDAGMLVAACIASCCGDEIAIAIERAARAKLVEK